MLKQGSLFIFTMLAAFNLNAQNGYEIKVNIKPFKNEYVYLGHYFGKQYPIIDSALLDDNGNAVFKGDKKLTGGIYLIGYPKKTGFFEILVDKQQKFEVIADTATIKGGATFINSPDNDLFKEYQQYMSARGKDITVAKQDLKTASKTDSAKLNRKLYVADSLIQAYRENIIRLHPDHILTALLIAMREPVIPVKWRNPKTKADSMNAYYYYRDHFFDGVNFWDGRLANTSFFEEKVEKYFNELMIPNPDSVIREMDRMLAFASPSPDMTKLLLLRFVTRYINQKYMWEDAVFVHLFEKYFANTEHSWLTPQGKKMISDRAYNLMANIVGTPAADIELPDTLGKKIRLYEQQGNFTLVAFWDATCGHCREVLPKIDSIYHAKWKAAGLKLFGVSKETDGRREDWIKFIREFNLKEWSHVYYTKAEDKARTDVNIPGYSQLYDVQTFPTLYLLDKEKRIIAKKISWEQMDEVLQVKLKER